MSTHSYANLLPPSWKTVVLEWFKEDCPSFDWGGYVVGEAERTATLLCKTEGVLAGVPFVNAVFEEMQCSVTWNFDEGYFFTAKDSVPGTPEGRVKVAVAHVRGPTRNLLLSARVALNTLARCSGIATAYVHHAHADLGAC